MAANKPETPYQRIVRAAHEGRGVRLSADECWQMAHDDAIATVASNDWEAQGTRPPPINYGAD